MKEDDYTLIDDFLHQRLNAEDAAAFEERLRQEPELAEATDFARLSHQFLDEQAEEDDFRQKLRAAAQAPNEQGRRGSLFPCHGDGPDRRVLSYRSTGALRPCCL